MIVIVIMMIGSLFISDLSAEEKLSPEDGIVKAVYETILAGDVDNFLTYCITKEKMKELTDGLSGDSGKEKSIKNEMLGLNIEEFKKESIEGFDKILATFKEDKLNLNNATNNGIVESKTRFEIPNLKAIKLRFNISFNEKNSYLVRLDLFNTGKDIFVYNVKVRKNEEKK